MNEHDVMRFVFQENLQHPLSIGRLCILAMFGPLNNGEIRCGIRKTHVLQPFEIDEMCLEFERDILIEVYMRDQQVRSCSIEDQQFIINQADGNLKRCKGKGYLKQITQAEVGRILADVPKIDGKYQFLEFQQAVMNVFAFVIG